MKHASDRRAATVSRISAGVVATSCKARPTPRDWARSALCICGVVPAQDTVFDELARLTQRLPLQRSALEVAPARGELPIDFEGQEPARLQRRQMARVAGKSHRVPGILQSIGKRNHGLGVAGTPHET